MKICNASNFGLGSRAHALTLPHCFFWINSTIIIVPDITIYLLDHVGTLVARYTPVKCPTQNYRLCVNEQRLLILISVTPPQVAFKFHLFESSCDLIYP